MITYTIFNKLLHLSRSGYLLQSIHNGQWNYPMKCQKCYAHIFKMCIDLSDKFDPNETIMHDLS